MDIVGHCFVDPCVMGASIVGCQKCIIFTILLIFPNVLLTNYVTFIAVYSKISIYASLYLYIETTVCGTPSYTMLYISKLATSTLSCRYTQLQTSGRFFNKPSLPSERQHPSYGDCLEVKREYYQNCSVLGCVTQCSQSAAYSCEQFLQVQQIGFVILGPLRHA